MKKFASIAASLVASAALSVPLAATTSAVSAPPAEAMAYSKTTTVLKGSAFKVNLSNANGSGHIVVDARKRTVTKPRTVAWVNAYTKVRMVYRSQDGTRYGPWRQYPSNQRLRVVTNASGMQVFVFYRQR
jgi:hypothetical protein